VLSILVGHSYFLGFDDKQRQRAKPYPPLATIQVAALLRDAGHDVSLFDAMLAGGLDDFGERLESVRPQVVVLYEDNYNFLSKMCLGRMRRACFEMIARARRAGARVIVGGSDVTDAAHGYIAAGAEVALLGEGLGTLMALLDRLDEAPALAEPRLVVGLPQLRSTTRPDASPSRVELPLPAPSMDRPPAWDLVDIDRYRRVWVDAHGYFSLNMAASRGCSFRCNWCAKPIWGNQYLQRAAKEVAAELHHLKRRYEVDHVWFADDIFGFRTSWVNEFADELAEHGDPVPFTIQLRADLVSPGMAAALARAGCREVWIGAESGSQRVLNAMNKGVSVPAIHRARRLFAEYGIRVGFFLMLGYLGEEFGDLLATRDLLELARPDDVGVSVAYPLPGTRFFEAVEHELGDQKNWHESKDLAMMFSGTYRSEFYRTVRDLLHEQVTEGLSVRLRLRWSELEAREAEFRQARVEPGLDPMPAGVIS